MIERYAVILTCFNRKDVTLRCLKQLYIQKSAIQIDVFLCDDGSSDGTYEAVRMYFPQVHVFKGTGKLFWNRGMLASWKMACDTGDYDAYIWLNDDTFIYDDALSEMIDCSNACGDKSIICGAFCSDSGDFSYGGRKKDNSPLIPNGSMQEVYWLNGNCVLVPKYVVNKIGLLDDMFQHHLGDFDYGLRAIEAGISIVTTRKYLGVCSPNKIVNSRSRKDGLSLIERFKRLYSPLGDNPFIQFRYTLRHFGLKHAIFIFLALHYNNLLTDKQYSYKMARKHLNTHTI